MLSSCSYDDLSQMGLLNCEYILKIGKMDISHVYK